MGKLDFNKEKKEARILEGKINNMETVILEKKESPPAYILICKDNRKFTYVIDRISSTGKYGGKTRINDKNFKSLFETLHELILKGYNPVY